MKFFETYSSNTLAGSANQHFFTLDKNEIHTGRVFYKIFHSGTYNYSLLFSNIIDSTYGKGDVSHHDLVCSSWKIHEAKVAKADKTADFANVFVDGKTDKIDFKLSEVSTLTFNNSTSKTVAPGEFFSSDPVKLAFEKGDYLCLEITFSGKMIPYHEESVLPVFRKIGNNWEYNRKMPFASMVGCDREVKGRIAFLGDSITQGIGPGYNTYKHWTALLADMLSDEYAYWNLGIGYARANDMASDGAWSYKAKQNDIVFVCYGVNDICQNKPIEQIEKDLETIVDNFKKINKKVILQAVCPFGYTEEARLKNLKINEFVKETLSKKADFFFDMSPVIQQKDRPGMAAYGDHPNEEGSRLWAEALFKALNDNNIL